jgi:hypothetical protein
MKKTAIVFVLALAAVWMSGCQPAASAAKAETAEAGGLDELRLSAYAQLNGEESVFHIKGTAYGFIPGQRPRPLFGLDGYNIRRLVPVPDSPGDLYLASREILFYTDAATGAAIDEWSSPYTGESVEVFHIQNDPVNFRFNSKDGRYVGATLDGSREFGPSPPPEEWSDYYVWHADIFPFYPLPGWEKNYTAGELFDFYVPKKGMGDDGPFETMVSWTRIGPWLPWMLMDGHEGLMVYHARSRRLASWGELPSWIRKRVQAEHAVYRHAPESVDPSVRNETSWTFYMKEQKRRAEAAGSAEQ